MTSNEIRTEIRKLFKAHGWSNRQVGLSVNYCGYSISVHATIKDLEISITDVEGIVNQFESVDYDKYTGEILAGGNTYCFCQYDDDILKNASQEYMEKAKQIISSTEECHVVDIVEHDGKILKFCKNGYASWTAINDINDYKSKRFARCAESLAETMALFIAHGNL